MSRPALGLFNVKFAKLAKVAFVFELAAHCGINFSVFGQLQVSSTPSVGTTCRTQLHLCPHAKAAATVRSAEDDIVEPYK